MLSFYFDISSVPPKSDKACSVVKFSQFYRFFWNFNTFMLETMISSDSNIKLNALSFQFIVQITLIKHQNWSYQLQFLSSNIKVRTYYSRKFMILDKKLKFPTSILKFGKRNLDYKLKIKRIQFYYPSFVLFFI